MTTKKLTLAILSAEIDALTGTLEKLSRRVDELESSPVSVPSTPGHSCALCGKSGPLHPAPIPISGPGSALLLKPVCRVCDPNG